MEKENSKFLDQIIEQLLGYRTHKSIKKARLKEKEIAKLIQLAMDVIPK